MDEKWVKVPEEMNDMFRTHPYTTMYLLTYGQVGNKWQMAPYKSLQQLHKACLRQGKTWQQLVGNITDDILL